MLLIGLIDGSTIAVQGNNFRNIETLQSDHEEADSRMFVYARYLVTHNQIGRIIIAYPDTDVSIIACFLFIKSLFSYSKVWLETRIANNFRYAAVHDICKKYSATFYMSLPVAHALTGCDSTSSFTGIGKKASLQNIANKNK